MNWFIQGDDKTSDGDRSDCEGDEMELRERNGASEKEEFRGWLLLKSTLQVARKMFC